MPETVNVSLTTDQLHLTIVALERYLSDTRREYEDGIDVGENVSGIRVRRDHIKAAIEALKAAS